MLRRISGKRKDKTIKYLISESDTITNKTDMGINTVMVYQWHHLETSLIFDTKLLSEKYHKPKYRLPKW